MRCALLHLVDKIIYVSVVCFHPSRYNEMLIVPVNLLEETNPFPLELTELEKEVDRLCSASYVRLRNE